MATLRGDDLKKVETYRKGRNIVKKLATRRCGGKTFQTKQVASAMALT